MTIGERMLIGFALIAPFVVLIGVPWFVFTGGIRKFGRRSLDRAFEGLDLHPQARPGDVSFVYHCYRGFLVWSVQTEHRVNAPPDHALILLKRLLRFNLTWGVMGYGVLFVPLLSVGNYLAQKNAIERQRRALAVNDG